MDVAELFMQLGLSLGLGLLVGIQRQRTESLIAGIRTFPLITLLGTLTALLAQFFGGWVLGLGFVALAGMTMAVNLSMRIQEAFQD